ncbi:MAG: (2Fe-2S) ferredoxin [Porticoccaceae bacterium]|nr:MAG: (2Fe-2S) ferredoxin [Porticoccaceae bacterium]
MPTVVYVKPDGTRQEVHLESGTTVMQGAVDNMVEGILGDCGGCCSCATCHVYVDEAWVDKVGKPDDVERDMLEFVINPKETSRLSCQIVVSDELDGLVVHLPESQY